MERFKFKQKPPLFVILADDMTGALDTAIKFAERGAKTIVINAQSAEELDSCLHEYYEVISINTATRHLSSSRAYNIIYNLSSSLLERGVKYIYKKTDSVLRGNIAAELEALKNAAKVPFIPFVPAHPRMGRTVEGGIMYVDGIPLEETPLADDPFCHLSGSCVGDIFSSSKLNVEYPVSPSCAPEKAGKEIFIYDSKSEEDLCTIAVLLMKKNIHVLSGCAGFASAFAENFTFEKKRVESLPPIFPLLILCGSVSAVSKTQLDKLEERGIARFRVNEEDLVNPSFFASLEGGKMMLSIRSELDRGHTVILDTLGRSREVRKSSIDVAEKVASALGEIGKSFFSLPHIAILVIGGDTLLSFLEKLGDITLRPLAEIEEGIVLTKLQFQGRDVVLLSKSGGFGDEEILARLLDRYSKTQEVIL